MECLLSIFNELDSGAPWAPEIFLTSHLDGFTFGELDIGQCRACNYCLSGIWKEMSNSFTRTIQNRLKQELPVSCQKIRQQAFRPLPRVVPCSLYTCLEEGKPAPPTVTKKQPDVKIGDRVQSLGVRYSTLQNSAQSDLVPRAARGWESVVEPLAGGRRR